MTKFLARLLAKLDICFNVYYEYSISSSNYGFLKDPSQPAKAPNLVLYDLKRYRITLTILRKSFVLFHLTYNEPRGTPYDV